MIAKARVAQLTGFPSITAAAEGPVTFGCFFYRWKARLLSGWGSSLAQGTGGRVRAPAPTAYPKVRLIFCRARCPHRAVPRRPSVPPLRNMGNFPVFPEGPVPDRPAGGQRPPLRRKTGRDRWLRKLRRRNETAPLPIFLPLRPPVGPDGMAPKHSWFCAPEGIYLPLGVTPVMGVLGDGRHGGGRRCRTADCARPLALFW